MAQDINDYGANWLLDALRTGKTLYAEPSSTPPNLDGSNVTPCGQGDKVRALVTFGAASARQMTSATDANFISGGGNASGNAGPFPYIQWYDAATGGNPLWRTALTSALAWVAGSPVKIAAGDLKLQYPAS